MTLVAVAVNYLLISASAAYTPRICPVTMDSLSRTSAAPGETLEIRGRWGVPSDKITFAITNDRRLVLDILSRQDRVIKVRLPVVITPGRYHVDAFCEFDGKPLIAGSLYIQVTPELSAQGMPAANSPPAGDSGKTLYDKAHALFSAEHIEESRDVFAEALAAYRREMNVLGKAACLEKLGATWSVLGDDAASDRAYMESVEILRHVLRTPHENIEREVYDEWPFLTIAYPNVLRGLLLRAKRMNDYAEARRIADERLAYALREQRSLYFMAEYEEVVGEIAEKNGLYETAIAAYRKCDEYFRGLDRRPAGIKCRDRAANIVKKAKER